MPSAVFLPDAKAFFAIAVPLALLSAAACSDDASAASRSFAVLTFLFPVTSDVLTHFCDCLYKYSRCLPGPALPVLFLPRINVPLGISRAVFFTVSVTSSTASRLTSAVTALSFVPDILGLSFDVTFAALSVSFIVSYMAFVFISFNMPSHAKKGRPIRPALRIFLRPVWWS